MAWVVKRWRTERFEEIVNSIRQDAERDARRLRRQASATSSDVAAQLESLERMSSDLRTSVRRYRETLRADAGTAPQSASAPMQREPPRRRKSTSAGERPRGRASLRDSVLADLFQSSGDAAPRATDNRPLHKAGERPAQPGGTKLGRS